VKKKYGQELSLKLPAKTRGRS